MSRPAIAVLLVSLVLWFALLGHRDLFDPDEGRYAEIPREMLADGDWVTPRLLGFKYFEKPPLQYWATAAAYALFGANAVTARLWPALLGFAGALFTGWLGGRLFGRRAGHIAFLVCVSGLMYVVLGHLLTLDMGLSVFLTLALGALSIAQTRRDSPGVCRGWMLLAWAMLGAAVLSKGLVAVALPAGALGIYAVWQRDWVLIRHLHPLEGVLVLGAVTGPWMVAAAIRNPEFVSFFFVHEHLQRFMTPVHHRTGPFYYFVAVFLAGAIPWTLLALAALARPGFSWRGGEGGFRPERLFWVYVLFVVSFFSVSQSKLPAYILPAWPFVAVLAGRRAADLVRWRGDGWLLAGSSLALIALAFSGGRFASDTVPAALLDAYRPWVLAAAMTFAAGALTQWRWRGMMEHGMAVTALWAMLSVQLLLWGAQALAPSRSGRELADIVSSLPPAEGAPVYFVGHYSPSLAFYLGEVPTIADYRGELSMGIDAEPARALAARGFLQCWRTPGDAVAVIDLRRERGLLTDLPGRVVHVGPRREVVVKAATELAGG